MMGKFGYFVISLEVLNKRREGKSFQDVSLSCAITQRTVSLRLEGLTSVTYCVPISRSLTVSGSQIT